MRAHNVFMDNKNETFDLSTTIQLKEDLLYSSIGDEIVLMTEESGEYFKLNSVGAAIWEIIKDPISLKDLISRLLNDFDVSEIQCKEEVQSYVNKLNQNKFIKIVY